MEAIKYKTKNASSGSVVANVGIVVKNNLGQHEVVAINAI
jgi:hypothetical protein